MTTLTGVPVRQRSLAPAWRAANGFVRARHVQALEPFRRPRPVLWFGANLLTWAVIVCAIAVAETWPWTLPFVWLVIASRQHALAVLMHDGAHGSIHANPRINLLLADVLAAWPLGITTAGFRRSHLAHHAHTHTDRDPDLQRKLADGADEWATPMTTGKLARLVALDLAGRGAFRMLRRSLWYGESARRNCARGSSTPGSSSRWIFAGLVVAIMTATNTWMGFGLYWLVPLLLVLPPMLRVRSLSEHFGLPHGDALTSTRDVEANWFEAQLFGPFGIRWHLAHHLFPDVPSVSVGKARRQLRRDEVYRRCGARARGYLWGRDSVRAALAMDAGCRHEC